MKDTVKLVNSKLPRNGKFFTIAIDGRAGSCKSTLSGHLQKLLPDFIHLNGDDYFEPTENKLFWGAFNDQRSINEVVKMLLSGNSFKYRPYNWHAGPPMFAHKIIVKYGLCLDRRYSFRFDLDWDLKIWLKTPKPLRLGREVTRGHLPKEIVMNSWQEVW